MVVLEKRSGSILNEMYGCIGKQDLSMDCIVVLEKRIEQINGLYGCIVKEE